MKFRKALITGGAGFIGSHLTEALIKTGMSVTVLDNLTVGLRENVPRTAHFVEGDIRDVSLMKELTRECDIVFHQAAKVSVRASIDQCCEDAENNLMGTLNVLRACEKSSVKKFVFASSMAVYADSTKPVPVKENNLTEPISPYGVAKLAGEKYSLLLCRHFGIDCIILRYFNTFGPRQTFTPYVGVMTIFINRLLQGESPVIFGSGTQMRDFVYVGSIVHANILAMKADLSQGIFNIGTGKSTTISELADLLKSRINPDIPLKYDKEQPGELKISLADISRAQEKIGYSPQWGVDEKIDEVIKYAKSKWP